MWVIDEHTFSAVSIGLTGASQKIASLVATANQAQFQARTLNPVLVQSLHGSQQVMVTSSSLGEPSQVTLIPQSVQLLQQPSASSGSHSAQTSAIQQALVSHSSQPVQLFQQQMFQQQVILQNPLGSDQHLQPQSDKDHWGSQEATFHVLVRI